MDDLVPFGLVVLGVGAALLLAIASTRITARTGIPAAAVFLIAAAGASALWPRLGDLSIQADQRIVTVALAVILFDGGLDIGRRRLRGVTGAVIWLGTAGTVVTAAAMALAAHAFFDFDWRLALLLGTALAPTDPAVVFSVLGRREIEGRTGTLLEGESGANDPVGITLMVSILGAASASGGAVASAVGQFALQMVVGLAVGGVGGWGLLHIMRRVSLPSPALYPLQAVAVALLIYGAGTAARGSGFLAVFVAGIVAGDALPHRGEIKRFTGALAGLAEMVAFVVLGLSISLASVFSSGRVWTGLGLAALLVLVARPLFGGLVLWPVRLRRGERAFVLWSGLKGAVPILLGTYVLTEGVAGAGRLYDVIFVVVTLSVLVQGGLIPVLARAWHVPMRPRQPDAGG